MILLEQLNRNAAGIQFSFIRSRYNESRPFELPMRATKTVNGRLACCDIIVTDNIPTECVIEDAEDKFNRLQHSKQ